ncbi:hypothetical protein NC653_033923 [Populus alba x Populus x berolinensis]|uniref:Uncharacterized protein n=1 Tax=Populus alba x Populus x berolinensis TaxID=444605 RepID=A0AAD6PZP0_9ROSI|nr:hypothetical protein NC653_033923 [Populus alba x Populus x berolinensis]
MSKYFVVASLDHTSFLVYPDNRYEHKLKHSGATKIVIRSLAPHKNIPPRVAVNTNKKNSIIAISRSIPILSFSIDSFPIEMYGSMSLCVYIDIDIDIYHVHGLTKMCKSSICICHSMSLFLFAYVIATPFGSIHQFGT